MKLTSLNSSDTRCYQRQPSYRLGTQPWKSRLRGIGAFHSPRESPPIPEINPRCPRYGAILTRSYHAHPECIGGPPHVRKTVRRRKCTRTRSVGRLKIPRLIFARTELAYYWLTAPRQITRLFVQTHDRLDLCDPLANVSSYRIHSSILTTYLYNNIIFVICIYVPTL